MGWGWGPRPGGSSPVHGAPGPVQDLQVITVRQAPVDARLLRLPRLSFGVVHTDAANLGAPGATGERWRPSRRSCRGDSGSSPSARILFGKDSGRRNPGSIRSGPRLRSKPLASKGTKGPAPGTAADAPSPLPANSGNVEGLQHLGVVDNEGGPQPVLEGTPVSRHAAAYGPSQMSLAEEVTCPGKGGAHLRLPGACRGAGARGGASGRMAPRTQARHFGLRGGGAPHEEAQTRPLEAAAVPGPLPSVTDLRYTGCRKCVSSAPCRPSTFQRRILSLQDMVRSLSPSRMPSHVGTMSLDSTGIVPSPVEGLGQSHSPAWHLDPSHGRQSCAQSGLTDPIAPTTCCNRGKQDREVLVLLERS